MTTTEKNGTAKVSKLVPVTAKQITSKAPAKSTPASALKTVAAKSSIAKETTPPVTIKPTQTSVAVSDEKAGKPKKVKLVRDSFTAPRNELSVLDDLKIRALSLKISVKKGELLRAGIKALAAMSDANFTSAISAVPALKTGRPKK